LELSLVPVPANQEALRRAVAKGFDLDFIKTIEADIEVTEVVEVETKGAVATELNIEEVREQKYENWCDVMEVINAFGCVYFDEATPVDAFQTLLTETVDLLQAVADGTMEDGETKSTVHKAIGTDLAKSFTVEEKAGAVLSNKNKELIKGALASMEGGVVALKELIASVEADTEEKAIEEETPVKPTEAVQDTGSVEAETVVVLSFAEVMENVQTLLRTNDKTNEAVLGIVNKFVAKKKAEQSA
jgi:hypothetical protein